MPDMPWNHLQFLTSPTTPASCPGCGQTRPLCPCSELHLLWSRSCLTAWVLYYSWINTLCLPTGLISSGTNLSNTAVWFLSQRTFVSGQFAVSIHLPHPYRYSIRLLWLGRIPCLLPLQCFPADYFHLIEKVYTTTAWSVWPCTVQACAQVYCTLMFGSTCISLFQQLHSQTRSWWVFCCLGFFCGFWLSLLLWFLFGCFFTENHTIHLKLLPKTSSELLHGNHTLPHNIAVVGLLTPRYTPLMTVQQNLKH